MAKKDPLEELKKGANKPISASSFEAERRAGSAAVSGAVAGAAGVAANSQRREEAAAPAASSSGNTPLSGSSFEAERREENSRRNDVLAQRQAERQAQQQRITARDKENSAKMQQIARQQQTQEKAETNVGDAAKGTMGRNPYLQNIGKPTPETTAQQQAYAEKYSGMTPQAAAATQRSERMAEQYWETKDYIENAKFDNPVDAVIFGAASQWATAPGEIATNIGRNIGEALADDEHQDVYVTPAMAQQTARGNTIARAMGIDVPEERELVPFQTIEGGKLADTEFNRAVQGLGNRILEAYGGGDPYGLDIEKAVANADEAFDFAKSQAKTPVGRIAVDAVQVVNDMAIALALSKGTGVDLSTVYAIRGGNEAVQNMLAEGYDIEEAAMYGLGVAAVARSVERGFGMGKQSGGLVDIAAQKIGNTAVKSFGKFVPGKNVATAIQVYTGLASKPVLGKALGAMGTAAGEGIEEGLEYCLTYALDFIFQREELDFEVKEMLYNMMMGAIGGAAFGGVNAIAQGDPYSGIDSWTRQTLKAEEVVDYLNALDPDIIAKAVEGDTDGMEAMMKGLDYEQLNENGKRIIQEAEILRKFREEATEETPAQEVATVQEAEVPAEPTPAPAVQEPTQQFFRPEDFARTQKGTQTEPFEVKGTGEHQFTIDPKNIRSVGDLQGFVTERVYNPVYTARQEAAKAQAAASAATEEDLPFGEEDSYVIKPKEATETQKTQRLRGREINTFVNSMKGIFGIRGKEATTEMKEAARGVLTKIQAGEGISEADLDRFYRTYAAESVIDLGDNRNIADVKAGLKGTVIYEEPGIVGEFGDLQSWKWFKSRMRQHGIKFSSDRYSAKVRHIDELYEELSGNAYDQAMDPSRVSGIAPEYFPRGETSPKEQLENILKVMDAPNKVYVGFKDYFEDSGGGNFEVWAKEQIREALNTMAESDSYLTRYEQSRKLDTQRRVSEMGAGVTEDEVLEAYKRLNAIEHRRERFNENSTLTAEDRKIIRLAAEGKMDESVVWNLKDADAEQLSELLEIEREAVPLEEIRNRWRSAIYAERDTKSLKLIKGADGWKDPAGLTLSMKTPERAFRLIAGNKDGKKLIDELIKPVHEAIAEKNRLLVESRARVIAATSEEIGKDGKPKQRKYNKYERAMAQMMLENAGYFATGQSNAVARDMQEQRVIDMQNLINDHGDKIDYEACAKLAVALENEYRIMHDAYNRAMVREGQKPMGEIDWYAPHFTAEPDPITVWEHIKNYIGIRSGSEAVPGEIAGLTQTFTPNRRYNAHANTRKSDTTTYDALAGFDQYADTTYENITATKAIRQLRSFEKMLRVIYSEDGVKERAQKIIEDPNLSEEAKDDQLDSLWKTKNIFGQSHFISWLHNYTNILAGKKSFGDREFEDQIGREMYEISKALEGRIAANMVGGNLSTAMTNVIPIMQMAPTMNPKYWVKGIFDTVRSYGTGNNFAADSNFLTNRRGDSPMMRGNYKLRNGENIREFMSWISDKSMGPMGFVDGFVSEAITRSYFEEGKAQGLGFEEAMEYADEKAAALMADRSKGAMPTIFEAKNPVTKAVTMFQVENLNQYEWFINDVVKNGFGSKKEGIATVAKIVGLLLSMRLTNMLFKELLGRDNVVPDPLKMGYDTAKGIIDGGDPYDVGKDVLTDAAAQAPFIGSFLEGGRIPLSSAIPDVDAFKSGIDNGQNLLSNVAENLMDPLMYVFFPAAYSQVRKTARGVGSLIDGEMTGIEDGEEYIKFIQNGDPWNIFRALVGGAYATTAGQEYIDSGFNSLSPEETKKLRAAEQYGIDTETFYNTLLENKEYGTNGARKLALYADPDLTEGEKDLLYALFFGGNPDRMGETPSSNNFTDEQIKTIGEALKGLTGKKAKREAIFELSGFTPEEKEYIERMYAGSSKTADYTDEETFRQSGLSERVARIEGAGLSPEEAKTVDKIIDGSGDSTEKTAAIAEQLGISELEAMRIYDIGAGNSWIEDVSDLSEKQRAKYDTVKERFPEMDDEMYFAVLNYGNIEGDVDEHGYSVYGSAEQNSIEAIAAVMGCSEEEAKLAYYQVEKFDYSKEDLTSRLQEMRYEEALLDGWSTEKYFAAKNAITLSGASKKADKLKALTEAGFTSSEANYFYKLQNKNNADYKNWAGLPEGFTEKASGGSYDLSAVGSDSNVSTKNSESSGGSSGGTGYYAGSKYYNSGSRRNLAKSHDETMTGKLYSTVISNMSQGTKDAYGRTIDGTAEAQSIANIQKALGCSEEEAKLRYYQVAKFDYERDDLSSTLQEMKYEKALIDGWNSQKYFHAINCCKLAGVALNSNSVYSVLTKSGYSGQDASYFSGLMKQKSADFKNWAGLPEDFKEAAADGVYNTFTVYDKNSVSSSSGGGSSRRISGGRSSIKGSGTVPEFMQGAPSLFEGMSSFDYIFGNILGGGNNLSTPSTEDGLFLNSLSTEDRAVYNAVAPYGWTGGDFSKALSIIKANGGKAASFEQLYKALLAAGFTAEKARGIINAMKNKPYFAG